MVAIVVTPTLLELLKTTNHLHKLEKSSTVQTITHTTLLSALHTLPNPPPLHKYLRSSTPEIHLSHAAATQLHTTHTRNPKLDRHIARLRARQADLEYARITRDVSRADASNAEMESLRMSKLAPQMSLGFNVVVTMATCFVAGFFVFKASSGSDTVGMIGGIAGMIVAMGVEAVLLITRMYSIEHEAERQAKKRWRVVEARR